VTILELIKRLLDYPLDYQVLVARDEEWNGIRLMHEVDEVVYDRVEREALLTHESEEDANAVVLT
jgi:hypothetical protein